jgi:hypothetical protein
MRLLHPQKENAASGAGEPEGPQNTGDVPSMKVNGTRRPKAAVVSDWRVL